MKNKLRIVFVEDRRDESLHIARALRLHEFCYNIALVDNAADFERAVGQNEVDLILADVCLHGFDGMAALRIALTNAPKAPFIFVTGSLPMEMQNDLVANGAVACIDKNQLCLLGDAVREALGSSTSV